MRKLTLLIIGVLLLTSCAQIHTARTVVARQYHLAVALEERGATKSTQPLSHPFTIDPSIMKGLMAQLFYTEDGEKLAVFQQDEIERLAPALTDALNKASAGQYVRFVSFSQRKGLFFSHGQKSEGGLFVTPDKHLNIAFNYINTRRSSSETSAMFHKYSSLDPLEIKTSATPLQVEEGMKLHHFADGSVAPMWLVVDVPIVEAELKHAARRAITTAPNSPEVNRGLTQAVPTSAASAMTAVAAEEKQQVIKKKLTFLKSLFEEGLISAEEYHAEKSAILALLK